MGALDVGVVAVGVTAAIADIPANAVDVAVDVDVVVGVDVDVDVDDVDDVDDDAVIDVAVE